MAEDNWGNPITQNFELAVAAGWCGNPPFQPMASRAQGYVATSSTSNQAVRSTTYAAPSSGGQRSFASSSANDANGGTGAWSVLLTYLDSTFAVHQETVVLAGATPVATVGTDVHYIESFVVTAVGTGQINQGVISLYTNNNGTGAVIASAAIGDNGTAYAHHYVPAGVSCYIIGFGGGGTVVGGTLNLIHMQNLQTPNAPAAQVGVSIVHPAVAQWDHEFQVPLVLPGPDLVWLNVQPVAVTASRCWAGFEYIQF